MSKYSFEVSFTPICASCGGELEVALTMDDWSRRENKHDPFWRDNPYERKDRVVMVSSCKECFVHKSEVPSTETKGSKS